MIPKAVYLDNPAVLLLRALIIAQGVTTANGNVGGTTLIDSALIGAVGMVNTTVLLFPGSPLQAQVRDSSAFNAVTGEITVSAAYSAQVVAGTPYVVLASPPTVAEVAAIAADLAALMADVGDASASVLGSLYAILGNPAQSFNTMVGYQGATALANKLTLARATNLDNLDATISGVNTRLGRQVPYIDYWSDVTPSITVTNVAADLTFPDVVVANLPAGAVITRVVAMLKCRAINNTNAAANNLAGAAKALRVKANAAAWPGVIAIDFANLEWPVAAAAKEGGDAIVGDNNLSATVVGNDTYNFASRQTVSLDAIVAALANLVLQDVQVGLRVYFLLA